MRVLTLVLAALAAGCGGGEAPPTPTADLPLPSDTILTPWVNVPAGAWLGGRRWVVVASEFNEASLVDFVAGTRRQLGGRGPAEIRNPYTVFVSNDTAWVPDWALRRATRWTPDGQPAGQVAANEVLGGALPAARDRAGQFYFEIRPDPGPDGSGNRDSAAVVRVAGERVDTVVRLSPLDLAEVQDVGGRRFERRVFSGQDRWGAFPDGTVWVARVYTNQILRLEPSGRRTLGPRLPDRVYEVTMVDRDHFVLQFPEELRNMAERLPYAPIKPPFEAAFGAPDGTVWLEKSRQAIDSVRTYHVTDSAGRLARILVLPSRQGRIIAVGDTLALVAEQWREGVRLMEVRVPRL